jgi:hypothetical protein
VLKVLQRRAIPFVIVSGCTFEMRGVLDSHLVLPKPIAPTDLWRTLSEILH